MSCAARERIRVAELDRDAALAKFEENKTLVVLLAAHWTARTPAASGDGRELVGFDTFEMRVAVISTVQTQFGARS